MACHMSMLLPDQILRSPINPIAFHIIYAPLYSSELKTWTLQVKTLSLHHKVLVLNALTYLILKIVQNVNITIALDIQLIGVENCMEKPFVHTILLRHLQLNGAQHVNPLVRLHWWLTLVIHMLSLSISFS